MQYTESKPRQIAYLRTETLYTESQPRQLIAERYTAPANNRILILKHTNDVRNIEQARQSY